MSQTEPCVHYWLLGDLAGLPRDQGRCKLCGAVKTFPLFMVDRGYDDLRVQRPNYLASEREIAAYMAERTREN